MTKQEERLAAKYPETDTFLWHNENPKGHITGDCLFRAAAGATGLKWTEVVDAVCERMKKDARDADFSMAKWLEGSGWTRHKQPRRDDGSKYTGEQWCKWLSVNYPNGELGSIIANIGGHHIVCIKPTNHGDGMNCRYKVLDIWNSTGKCIGIWWAKGANHE